MLGITFYIVMLSFVMLSIIILSASFSYCIADCGYVECLGIHFWDYFHKCECSITITICNNQHNALSIWTFSIMYNYGKCRIFLWLCWVLSWWASLCWVFNFLIALLLVVMPSVMASIFEMTLYKCECSITITVRNNQHNNTCIWTISIMHNYA